MMKKSGSEKCRIKKCRIKKGRTIKGIKLFLCGFLMLLLAGCGSTQQGQAENAAEPDNLKQAGLGAMSLLYDDSVWTYAEAESTDASLVFRDAAESVLGVSCSRESYYQHPLDMLNTAKQIYATFAGYEEIEAPTEVQVQGESWYEWCCSYEEEGVETVVLQRFYGKNYYAYAISYTAQKDDYEAGRNEALKVMNSVVMSVPDNAEAEEKAKKFLVGEWDLGDAGYLVMEQDGTYTWYMDSSKDEKNMHRGTYGCDVENTTVGFAEGEGIYFVLFPEVLYADGKEGQTGSPKYDYLVSLEQQPDGSYQMLNGATLVLYYMTKQ